MTAIELGLQEAGYRLARSEVLPWKLTNRNDGQGRHWSASHISRRNAERMAVCFKRKPMDCKCTVVVTRILGKGERAWDPSSILRGNWKQLEDALVKAGWWHDDGPQWIEAVVGFQNEMSRATGPATKIDIWVKE